MKKLTAQHRVIGGVFCLFFLGSITQAQDDGTIITTSEEPVVVIDSYEAALDQNTKQSDLNIGEAVEPDFFNDIVDRIRGIFTNDDGSVEIGFLGGVFKSNTPALTINQEGDAILQGDLTALSVKSAGDLTVGSPEEVSNTEGKAITIGDKDRGVIELHGGDGQDIIAKGIVQTGKFGMEIGTLTNQVLKFFTNSTPRMSITSDGNVGIGTDDPGAKLHVDNHRLDITTSAASGGGQNRFNGLIDEGRRGQLVLSSSYSDLVIASSQANNSHGSTLTFATYNPSDATDYKKWVVNQGNWGSRKQFLDFGYSDTAGRTNPHSNINTTDTVLTLDGINKRVGIGTTSPGAKLDVAGDMKLGKTDSRHFLQIASLQWPEVRFTTPSFTSDMRIGMAHADNDGYGLKNGDFYVYSPGVNRMDLAVKRAGGVVLAGKGGNVGIGTTDPGAKLEVAGDTKVSGSVIADYLKVDPQNAVLEGGEIQLRKSADTYSDIQIDNYAGNARIHTLAEGKYFEVVGGAGIKAKSFVGDGSQLTGIEGKFTDGTSATDAVFTTGNVGIGTTDPKSKLEIADSDYVDLSVNQTDSGLIRMGVTSGTATGFLIADSNLDGVDPQLRFLLADDSANYGYNETMRINSAGNVGIGTTSPGAKLHVDNHRLDITTSAASGGGQNRFNGLIDEGRRGQLVLSSSYSDLVIASSQTNNSHGSTLTFATYNPSDATDYKKWVVNQGNWGSRKQFLDFGYSDTAGRTNPHSNINTTDTVLTLDGINKRVGIGTTDPKEKLHVDNHRLDITTSAASGGGQNRFNGLIDEGRRGQLVLSSSYSDLVIASSQANNSHGSTLTFATYNPSDATDYKKWVVNQGNWGSRKQFLDFGYSDTAGRTNPHSNINTTDTVLTLDGINKRVGIGTTSPGAKLDVAGDMKLGKTDSRHFLQIASLQWPEVRFTTPSFTSDMRIGMAHADNDGYGLKNGDFYVYSPGVNRMDLAVKRAGGVVLAGKGGNVGIGTTDPGAKLEVDGGAIKVSPAYEETFMFGNTNETGTPSGDGFRFVFTDDIQSEHHDFVAFQKTDGNGANPDGGFVFQGRGNDGVIENIMTVDTQNNRVGIGTTYPAVRLEVDGDFKVEGDGSLVIGDRQGAKCSDTSYCGTEAVFLQTTIDGKNADYTPATYGGEYRHVLSLQPDGGNVGIGTSSPSSKLDVRGNVGTSGHLTVGEGGYNKTIKVRHINGKDHDSDDNSALYLNYNTGQSVVVGKNDKYSNLVVYGNTTSNSFLYSSDQNKKKDIQTLSNPLETIQNLRGVSFSWKENDEASIGFIAQEVEKVLPSLVSGEAGEKSVAYGNLTAVLVEAVKQQQKQIAELRAALEELNSDKNS